MIEVEVKVKVDDKVSIINGLIMLGFKRANTVRETDMYFNGVDRDFRQSDEALRLRKTESLDGSGIKADSDEALCTITYKGKKLDNISMSRREIETEVEDFEAMKNILVSLGYKPVAPVVKERTYYFSEDMAACVDSVIGLGDFIELEIMVDNEAERENALLKISGVLEKLGHSMYDVINVSYLSMLEKMSE